MRMYDKMHAYKHSTHLHIDLVMNQNFIIRLLFNPVTLTSVTFTTMSPLSIFTSSQLTIRILNQNDRLWIDF